MLSVSGAFWARIIMHMEHMRIIPVIMLRFCFMEGALLSPKMPQL